jgi:hypothetical protein
MKGRLKRIKTKALIMKIPTFTSLLIADPSLTADDAVDTAMQTWDQLDAYVTDEQNFASDYLTPKTPLADVYQRIDMVMRQLAAGLSKEFKVKISPAEISKCTTFGDLSVLISQKRLT